MKNMNWKVLYVASRSEKKVYEKLKELGVHCYLPLKTEKRQWSDRIKTVTMPIINGYVFVRVDEKQRDKVFNVNGVVNYVRYNGSDAIVKKIEIESLKMVENYGFFVESGSNIEINIDDLVSIQYGPFKGLNGVVSEDGSNNIYSISILSIGYSLTVKVPKEILVKT